MIKWEEDWAEIIALFFVIIGLIISLFLRDPIFSYISIVLAGFLAGRNYYIKRFQEPVLPFILIIVGFLLGYIIGSFGVNRVAILLLFILSFSASYYLHLKKILVIFKNKDFVK